MTEMLTFQGSLLDAVTTTPGYAADFAGIRRHHLPDGAWVDRLPDWVRGADLLYDAAERHLPWRAGTERIRGADVPRPRLVANVDRQALPPELALLGELSDALSERYGVALDRITCNLYRLRVTVGSVRRRRVSGRARSTRRASRTPHRSSWCGRDLCGPPCAPAG